MNLLIVDDENIEIQIIKKLIDTEKIAAEHIFSADSSEEAMEIIQNYPVNILLCDIEMPHKSGHDLVRWIRQNNLNIHVVYLTAHARFEYATTALRLGVKDYLLKPVEKTVLNDTLYNIIANDESLFSSDQNKVSVKDAERIVKDIKNYIEKHYGDDLHRTEIAELFYIHPDYLSHIFREYEGVSFKDYLIATRMKNAKKYLAENRFNISEVAQKVGYTNTSYFTKHFKRFSGVTPKEYIHKMKGLS